LIAIYILLGMLYESTITIISTLPSAGLGALLSLMLFGMPLDVIGIIGIILLIGIVKKNGIMLVDLRAGGSACARAQHRGCDPRGLPPALSSNSEIRQPLGYAIVAGLWISQVLTLFTTPVVSIYRDRVGHWLGRPYAA
jgi:multidrug efflux pump subunit AcrB